MRVLIVDDAAVERATLARLLGALGHEVVGAAATLSEALSLARTCRPECALIDGRLPGGGPEAIAALHAACPGLRLAVIAALGEAPLVRSAVAAGARGALRRPLLRSAVASVLAELVASR